MKSIDRIESAYALTPPLKEVDLEEVISRGQTITSAPEKTPSTVHVALDSFCQLFSQGNFSDQPPGTDLPDTSTDLLIQMFMSELGPAVDGLSPADTPSSPASSITPSLSLTPVHTPLLPPSPALHSPLAQVPTCSSTPSVPEAPRSPNLDDPFLIGFADLDGLLKESALFENSPSENPPLSSSSSDVDTTSFVFPFSDAHAQDPLLLGLSECLSMPSPSPSLSSTSLTLSEPSLDFDGAIALLSPQLPDLPVHHDHAYTSEHPHLNTNSCNATGQRKRSASEVDSFLTPASPTGSPPKKAKQQIVKDKKYQIRRQKNNVASQVSRAKRRTKHTSMFSRVSELEESNAQLKQQVLDMEAEAARLRMSLVNKLST